MKRIVCAVLLLVPAISFFMEDFGEATIGLRIFGVCLVLLIIADFVFKKNLIIPVCKVCYCILYVPFVLYRMRKDRKKKQRDEDFRRFWNGFHWYW